MTKVRFAIHCGCGKSFIAHLKSEVLTCFRDATEHSKESKHTLKIEGEIGTPREKLLHAAT